MKQRVPLVDSSRNKAVPQGGLTGQDSTCVSPGFGHEAVVGFPANYTVRRIHTAIDCTWSISAIPGLVFQLKSLEL